MPGSNRPRPSWEYKTRQLHCCCSQSHWNCCKMLCDINYLPTSHRFNLRAIFLCCTGNAGVTIGIIDKQPNQSQTSLKLCELYLISFSFSLQASIYARILRHFKGDIQTAGMGWNMCHHKLKWNLFFDCLIWIIAMKNWIWKQSFEIEFKRSLKHRFSQSHFILYTFM